MTASTAALRFDKTPDCAQVGAIVLSTDYTLERDFARLLPPQHIAVYVTRIHYDNPTTEANLAAMAPHITECAQRILPDATLDAVVFACTSATAVIGQQKISAAVNAAKSDAVCITPISAAIDAFKAINIRTISIMAPYVASVSQRLAKCFAAHSLNVCQLDSLGLEDDRDIARLSTQSIIDAAIAANHPQAEAVFLSCTALRACSVIKEIESRINKPVITSNQAMAWQLLQLHKVNHHITEFGRLLTVN